MNELVPSGESPDAGSIRAQLQRILGSATFSSAPVLTQFLRYVVEQNIRGTQTRLKEYTLGVEVFQRSTRFDPHTDTIVRVQARRLRKRLSHYYANEGRTDAILIAVPKGHYRAEIVTRPIATQSASNAAEQIVWRVSETGVPPRAFRSHAVPAPRTSLVGRGTEVAQLCSMLADAHGPRLVTLTGPAGSGKTRLAVEVGLLVNARFSANVMYLPLAAVADAHALQLDLLHNFGLHVADNTPVTETLYGHLQSVERPLLLILDNFEQIAAAAPIVGSMLDASQSLKVLVTSRVALRLYGECEYPVSPLALPALDSTSPSDVALAPAVELFVRRASAARPGFSLDATNALAITRICRSFDGLPLGIELAAAQCRTLTPVQLTQRLPLRLNIAANNSADVPDRQRTLRHAIEWSYALLTESERRLLRRVSIFAGGFTLQAAEAVANARSDLGIHTCTGLDQLIKNNLLRTSPDLDDPRYVMLETIREFALEQLTASGEDRDVAKAHASWYLSLAETGSRSTDAHVFQRWLAQCDLEQDNFRSALDGLINRDHGQWALRLVTALFLYWERRGYLAAALDSILPVLTRFGPAADPETWGKLACLAATIEHRVGSPEAAMAHCVAALAVAREHGDRATEAMALNRIADLHIHT